MSRQLDRTIAFAGGGTAGHIEPALAAARAWKAKYPQDRCIFLGTPSGLENILIPAAGFELFDIHKVVMPRSLNLNLVLLPWQLLRSVISAMKVIKGSQLLVGFGGYLSASAYLAAFIARVPIVVHEANAKVGWANRLGAILTRYVAVARPIAKGSFSRAKVTGLPLRRDVRAAYFKATADWHKARLEAKKLMGWEVGRPALLILGGSQGSTFINSQIARALPQLNEKRIQILHSVGSANELPADFEYYKAVPYITDVATAYLAADVVLARSGAVTCAEVAALGRFAIFVPLPIGNGEQARNAEDLVSKGRAMVVTQEDFSSDWLLSHIDGALERSRELSDSGLNQDLDAEHRIMMIMEDAISGRKR